MCHTFLKIDLGPKINFIVGHNGSGKSAVLTALTVCLGARATLTNRANSVKDFLKEGCNVGSITVTIRNEGNDAYKPSEYGDRIIVERKISREGSGGYKIRAKNGRVISTKREELLNIMDSMGIHADNPMTILTQDAARGFLANSTSKEKYQFFLTGTGLRQLSADYSVITESRHTLDQQIRRRSEVLPDMKKEVKRLEQVVKGLERARKIEEEVAMLKEMWVWSEVKEVEQNLEARKADVVQKQRCLTKVTQKLQNSVAKCEELDGQVQALEAQLAAQQGRSAPLVRQRADLRAELEEVHKALREVDNEIQEMNEAVTLNRRNIADIDRRIEEETQKLQVDGQMTRFNQLAAIKAREDAKAEIEATLRRYDGERAAVDQEWDQAKRAVHDLTSNMQRLQTAQRSQQDRLHSLSNQSSDRLEAFGREMRRVMEQIERFEREKRWKGAKPLGPIGLHVKLRQTDFGNAIETLLGNTLNSFAVETPEDVLTLQKHILDPCGCRSSILRYRNQRIDISRGEPHKDLMTVYRAIEVDNEIILRQLVLNHAVEKSVLVYTRREGEQITGGGFPQNVNVVVTKNCFSVGNRGGGLSTSSLMQYRGRPRILQDISSVIREAERELRATESEIDRLGPLLLEAKGHLRHVEDKQKTLRNEHAKSQRHHTQTVQDIAQMNDDLVDENEGDNIGPLREAKRAEEANIEATANQSRECLRRQQDLRASEQPIRHQIQHLDDEQRIIEREINQVVEHINAATLALAQTTAQRERYEAGLVQAQGDLRDAEQAVAEAEEALRSEVEKAEAYCERVEPRSGREALEHDIRTLEATIRQIAQTHGDYNVMKTTYLAKLHAYEEARNEIKDWRKLGQAVGEALNVRMAQWIAYRGYVSIRAKFLFGELMGKRGYRGRLKLNHQAGALELAVTVNSDESSRSAKGKGKEKDPRSLSGGEKSFSTVCLLLALWESMGSPFRALDEFDVFMDAVNRRAAMTAMIENARESDKPCQYIFITPQTMGSVPGLNGDDVRVHRMMDPNRANFFGAAAAGGASQA
ncbi:uncharacterized protein EV422DRAFT_94634 [Fimicolochytrium jonesii]|uniref:uncharacterized protein n=1 Tax=Fimicolochytrium jonesii TaxID=1396493 RepID=UPI0022FE45BB|nr:uncharacterized protein EV422DRAFT_94634 [Fimicolochytrium jonesii]KAI8819994.1 hypothetical protein EV422DRAFT_94634 [Fimicolochytrium jonesii]